MANRHVHRADACPRSQYLTDCFTVIDERRARPSFVTRFIVSADEAALRDADGRAVQEDPQVTRQTEAPRVCVTVPVRQQ